MAIITGALLQATVRVSGNLQCWYDCGKQNFFTLMRVLSELDLFGNDSNGLCFTVETFSLVFPNGFVL